jgi:predicted nucleic acid-binding protein
MSSGPVISNSSPLIALEQIGQLALLEALFTSVVIPPAVAREVAPSVTLPSWIFEQALTQPLGAQVLGASLGPGESEATSLAVEQGAGWVLLDDRPARRIAGALDLPIIGTLGILLAAKRRGLLPAVKPYLDYLNQVGFRIAPALYQRVLQDAGEAP